MKGLLIPAWLLYCAHYTFAQPTFMLRTNDDPKKVLPASFRFINGEYRKGYLTFPMARKSATLNLNFDLFTNTLTFINEKNDTLIVKDDVAVKYARMGEDVFYHDVHLGYFKILATDTVRSLTSHVELTRQLHTVPADEGYGSTTNGTSSTVVVSRNQDVTLQRITTYFLMDQRLSIIKANRWGFLKLFKDNEKNVRTYLKQSNINFKKEEDLLSLFNHCLALQENIINK